MKCMSCTDFNICGNGLFWLLGRRKLIFPSGHLSTKVSSQRSQLLAAALSLYHLNNKVIG